MVLLFGLGQPGYGQSASTGATPITESTACHSVAHAGWTPYRAQPGDTLADLARKHGVSVEEIRQQNCLITAEIQPNHLLLLPAPMPAADLLPTVAAFTPTPPLLPTATPLTTSEAAPQPTSPPSVISQLGRTSQTGATIIQPVTGATAQPTGLPQAQATPTAALQQNLMQNRLSALSTQAAGWVRSIMLLDLLIIIMTLLVAYLTIRRRKNTGAALDQPQPRFGYLLFLLTGILFGLFAFPVLQPPIQADLFAAVRVIGSFSLVAGLAIKELLVAFDQRWRLVKATLNVALIPLWLIFLLTIVSQILQPR